MTLDGALDNLLGVGASDGGAFHRVAQHHASAPGEKRLDRRDSRAELEAGLGNVIGGSPNMDGA